MVDAEAEQAEPLARRRRAGNAGERVAGEPARREPPKRERRSPNTGKQGEKTADGRPKPDERTVADLVRRGWFKSEEAAVALLTRAQSRTERFPFETAGRAADWLEATLGPEPVKDGLCPAARAVTREPQVLARDAATLQCKWDALTLSAEQGGVGIELSTEQARKAFSKHLPLLNYSVETYRTGWSMLTVTEAKGGLGLSLEKARECILRVPEVLRFDHNKVVLRVDLLKSLGYAEARTMVLTQPRVLTFKEETVKEHAAWWKQSGLDHVKLVTATPTLLGGVSAKELQARLEFLRDIAKLSVSDLNRGGPFFTTKFDTLRSRFFYALKHDALERYKLSSLTFCTDARFLRFVHQLDALADASTIAEYKQEVASAAFQAWAAEEEARRL